MSLFQLDWLCCQDGYSIEKREPPENRKKQSALGKSVNSGGLFIVANSGKFNPSRPMAFEGLYRQFTDSEPTPEGLLTFVNRFGFLQQPRSRGEPLDFSLDLQTAMKSLVSAIDRKDWQTIANVLDTAGGRIGRLGVVFELPEGSDHPQLKLKPADLFQAMQVQALSDASLGIKLRKCKNPGCPEYFATSGPNAKRDGAEYHHPKCQRHHAYLKRKGALS